MILWIYDKLLLYSVNRKSMRLFNFLCSFEKLNQAYMEKELKELEEFSTIEMSEEQSQRIYNNIMEEVRKSGFHNPNI